MGNECIYSVSKDLVEQKCQNSKTECFVSISREGLTRKALVKTKLSRFFAFQSCAQHVATLWVIIVIAISGTP